MGYKKLDEVMELLNDELDGFNRSLEKLEKLTKNADNIKIRPDTSEIEHMLKEHLNTEKTKFSTLQESIVDIEKQISKARIIPKTQLWIQYSIWVFSLIIIGYLSFQVSRIGHIEERAISKGEQKVISNLKGYFDQYPEHYVSYQSWIKKKVSVPD